MSTQMTSSFTRVLLGACAGAALFAFGAIAAQASIPAQPFPAAVAAGTDAHAILAEGDCGIGRWRGPEGHCHPDRERVVVDPLLPVVPPVVVETPVVKVCPIHMHWSPRRRECVYN